MKTGGRACTRRTGVAGYDVYEKDRGAVDVGGPEAPSGDQKAVSSRRRLPALCDPATPRVYSSLSVRQASIIYEVCDLRV